MLDEPTAELDPEQRLHFRELISEVRRPRAVVLSTHQTEDVAALCSRVVVLCDGAVAFDGHADRARRARPGPRVGRPTNACPGATVAWRTGDGAHRHVGDRATRARGSSSRRSRTAT